MQEYACMPDATTRLDMLSSQASNGFLDLTVAQSDAGVVYATGPSGTFATSWWGCNDNPLCGPQLDAMGGDKVDRGPGFLLLSGALALPLATFAELIPMEFGSEQGVAQEDYNPPPCTRITGPRHGSMTAIVDTDGNDVVLAGPAGRARLDLDTLAFTSWELTSTASSARAPRAIAGHSRLAPVDTTASSVCSSCGETAPVATLDLDGSETLTFPAGLSSSSIDVGAQTIWGLGYGEYCQAGERGASAEPPRVVANPQLNSWPLSGGLVSAQFSVELPLGDGGPDWDWSKLRVSDRQDQLLLMTPAYAATEQTRLELRVFDTTALGTAALPPPAMVWTLEGPVDRHLAAVDGNAFLVGGMQRVTLLCSLYGDLELPTPQIQFLEANPNQTVRVAWMRDGRAWVGWESPNGVYYPETGARLTQLSYLTMGGVGLTAHGDVPLPAPVETLYDNGTYAVATTVSGVHIIAPACQ